MDRVVEFRGDELIIGRGEKCDVILGEATVSTRHARVFRRADGYVLEDLNSRNNTVLDGMKLKGRGAVPLLEGQAFRICDYWLLFQTKVRVEEDGENSSAIKMSEVATGSGLSLSPAKPEKVLEALLAVGNALGSTLDPRLVLDKALESLFKIFPQAERGFVYLDESKDGSTSMELVPIASRKRQKDDRPLTISRVVLKKVLGEGRAICCTDAAKDELMATSDTIMSEGIRTFICAPILDRAQKPIGLLQLDRRESRHQFEPKDLDLLIPVVSQVSVAVENARLHEDLLRRKRDEQEMNYARKVLLALLPERTPSVPGFSFWHHYEPAHEVGGDYFGYFPLTGPEESGRDASPHLAVAVADVVGKGMGAALLMVKLSAEVQFSLVGGLDPPRVIQQINRRICELGMDDKFITFLLTFLDPERGVLTVVSAGHPAPVVRKSDGQIGEACGQAFGFPLGIEERASYQTFTIELEPGDCAVLYTDGITEAYDGKGEQFGPERLNLAISRASGSVAAVGNSVLADVHAHRGSSPQSDDITLICLAREADRTTTMDMPVASFSGRSR